MRRAPLLLAGVLACSAPAAASRAQTMPTILRSVSDSYAAIIAEAAERFAIPVAWIRAVMRIESRSNRRAVSPKGAMGLMQLMPETWATLRARYGLGRDPFDPHDNIVAGAAYLREMHDRYGSPGFLAAYNAGPRHYEDYRDRHRSLPAETLAYVARFAPFVGAGAIDAPVLVPAVARPSWAQAPLFIAQPGSAQPADHAPSKSPPSDGPAVVPVRDLSGVTPQSAGLFAPVSVAAANP